VAYIPERGDLIWLTFDPQAGHEQAGRRPAVVLSPLSYNSKTDLAILCPITNRAKGYPYEVPIPSEVGITGVVLSDQAKSLDWRVRQAEFISKLPQSTLNIILKKLNTLLAIDSTPS